MRPDEEPDDWRKSSKSSYSGQCLVVATKQGEKIVLVRDSAFRNSAFVGPILHIPVAAWQKFIDDIKRENPNLYLVALAPDQGPGKVAHAALKQL